jgi:PmbA protein
LEAELAIARDAVALAKRAGAHEAEATFVVARRFSTEARGAEIAKLEQSVGRSLTLRVFVDRAKASLATTDFSPAALEAFVRETVDAARFVEGDEFGSLPDSTHPAPSDAGLGMYAGDVDTRDAEAKIGDALELESIARATSARIVNSGGSRVIDASLALALANSNGFAGAYRSSHATILCSPIAQDGVAKLTGHYGSASRSYATLEAVGAVASKAAHRALGMIGARKPPTMRCPVIFDRDVASSVLGDIFSAVNAANVSIGNSFLLGKIGDCIGSDLVTIFDDGTLPHALGTSPFDSEGTPTSRTPVFERGQLRTFLYDTYYSRKLGASSTGNASGGGIGPNNFYLEAGVRTPEELIASTSRGVLVMDTIGFATESVTGTYSRGARGYYIENGEIAYPIDEFTIAGNFLEMLAAVDAVASDLVFDQSIVSPTFRVAEMTVSGGS